MLMLVLMLGLRLLVGDRRHHSPLGVHLTAAVGGEDGKIVGERRSAVMRGLWGMLLSSPGEWE